MGKFRKRRQIVGLAVAITVIAVMVTGCSDQGRLFPDHRTALRERIGNTGLFSSPGSFETYEKTTETIGAEENVREICVDTSLVDVKIYSAKEKGKFVSDGEILIEKNTGKKSPDIDVYAKNGVLNIVQAANQENMEFPYNSEVFIYLPENMYLENIYAEGEDGNIEVTGNLSVGKMTIELASGDIDIVGNVSITSDLYIETVNGMMDIETVTCGGSLNLYTESGDIEFSGSVQEDMSVKTEDGDVVVSGTMCKNLKVNTRIGRIELDDVSCNGRLALYSESGDIEFSGDSKGKLTVETGDGDIDVSDTVADDLTLLSRVGHVSVSLSGNAWDYNYDISSEYGDLYLNGENYSDIPNTLKKQNNVSGNKITISTESGDIDIETEE